MKFTAHRPLAPHFDNFYSVCRSYWPRWRASSYSGDLYISPLQCPHRFRIIFLPRTFFLAARGGRVPCPRSEKTSSHSRDTARSRQGAKSPPPTPKALPTYLLQQKNKCGGGGKLFAKSSAERIQHPGHGLSLGEEEGGGGGLLYCVQKLLWHFARCDDDGTRQQPAILHPSFLRKVMTSNHRAAESWPPSLCRPPLCVNGGKIRGFVRRREKRRFVTNSSRVRKARATVDRPYIKQIERRIRQFVSFPFCSMSIFPTFFSNNFEKRNPNFTRAGESLTVV